MKKIAVIGAGISGLAIANCLTNEYNVTVFETANKVGGLIKCDRINGNLYHMVGGHVFNSKREDVLNWFWKFFDKENEFTKSVRHATIFLDKHIDYPIENHVYQLDSETVKKIVSDLIGLIKLNKSEPVNFEDFLRSNFGDTLYKLYFKPYNEKIWKRELSDVPLGWLEGKLPMPSIEEILYNNFHREKEMKMVHSTFYYPKNGGSQFLANRLSEGLNIFTNSEVENIAKNENGKYLINDSKDEYDIVIYTGNIQTLSSVFSNLPLTDETVDAIAHLQYHGTTTALCKLTPVPYSWIYLPSKDYVPHRIICTGNFAESNNMEGTKTATVEFTDFLEKEELLENLKMLPHSLEYIDHRYTKYTYPIQNRATKMLIDNTKKILENQNFYLLGRFAEWEYYNMDAAIGAALDLSKKIKL